jgi:hypothetical protein
MTTLREELDPKTAISLTSRGTSEPKQFSEEAAKILNLSPVKTAWGWDHGRPVYNRLPMVSEGYQKSYDKDHALVYINLKETNRAVGVNTLEVTKNKSDWRILEIEGGTVIWEYGEAKCEAIGVDTRQFNNELGLQVGSYQVGYRLTHFEEKPKTARAGFAIAYAEDAFVADIELGYHANREVFDHRQEYAVYTSTDGRSWWPNRVAEAGGYYKPAEFTFDFLEPVEAESVTVHSDRTHDSAKMAVYGSDDAIIWHLRNQVRAEKGSWTASLPAVPDRYRKMFFWDGSVSISNIQYTGNAYFLDRAVYPPQTETELFIESMYEEIEGNFILLATFDVHENGSITSVRDMRRVTYEKYEPVSDWLTKFEDEQLRCLFDDVVEYSRMYMSPPTADFHLYNELDYSNCFGRDQISLGSKEEELQIHFPDEVEFVEAASLPTASNTIVDVTSIDLLADPTDESSVATKKYTDYALKESWSLDNGNY